MNTNIEALVSSHCTEWVEDKGASWVDHMRNALTEQAEAFKGELQVYDGMVRELTKTVEDMRAAQSVPVVGDVVAYMLPDGEIRHGCECTAGSFEVVYGYPLIVQPTTSITAAELATLREKAAEADELQKRAETMQKALSDIAEWTDRYTTPGHPVSTIASAAIAQGKGE